MTHALAALALALCAPQQREDPDLLYKPDLGVSIRKIPRNDEWGFKDQGMFTNSKLVVAHKVDDLMIEIMVQEKAPGLSAYDLTKAAEQDFKQFSALDGVEDAKKLLAKNEKLPGGGASNVMASHLIMTYARESKERELQSWVFIGKQNQNLYRVVLTGDAGMYKKHRRFADYILSTIDIHKIK